MKNSPNISAVILTKNEKNNIKDCIKTLYFCDEIVVIDDVSSDNTREIASELGVKVYKKKMDKNISDQSNFGMKNASGDWILFVDADERVSKELSKEIIKQTRECSWEINGFFIRRMDIIWGKLLMHGESANISILRLVRRASGYWERRVHQKFIIKGKTSVLKNCLYHYPHQSVSEFIISVNRWSLWHALANNEEGKISSTIKIVFWPILHFIKNYIFRLGFLDGLRGFIFAVIMSFHSFLAWGNLYVKQKK